METSIICPHCKVSVVPVVKIFNTKICPKCSIIISSDKGITKGDR